MATECVQFIYCPDGDHALDDESEMDYELELAETGVLLLMALCNPACVSADDLTVLSGLPDYQAASFLRGLVTMGLAEAVVSDFDTSYALTREGRGWLEREGLVRWRSGPTLKPWLLDHQLSPTEKRPPRARRHERTSGL